MFLIGLSRADDDRLLTRCVLNVDKVDSTRVLEINNTIPFNSQTGILTVILLAFYSSVRQAKESVHVSQKMLLLLAYSWTVSLVESYSLGKRTTFQTRSSCAVRRRT